jgi:long-chain fatty acid transport protein
MSVCSGFTYLFCPTLDINMLYISRINTLPVDEMRVTRGMVFAIKGPIKSINGNPRSLQMKKRQKQDIFRMLTIILNITVLQMALADGYRNPPPTAEGVAKAGVNSVFVDDASAISYNPANLTLQTNASVVINTTFARTENKYNRSFPDLPSVTSENSWNVLPNLYASTPIGDGGIVVGLGVSTPFGQGIEWDSLDVYNGYAPVSLYEAEIKVIHINPTIAFNLGDRISVGFGPDIYYSELDFKALIGTIPPPTPPAAPSAPTAQAKADGHDWAIGGNIGLTWQMTEKQRATLRYSSQVDMNYKGDYKVAGITVGDFSTKIRYPNKVGLGYGIQLTDTIQIEGLVEWLEWSVNDTVTSDAAGTRLEQENDWDDTFTAGIGASWNASDALVFRAGYSFIESPVPKSTISPILPDADRHVIGLGLGYTLEGHTIDLSYAFSIYKDRKGTSRAYPGDYDIDSDLVGLTYSYSF